MWSERDQIQAHQFLRRRLVSALSAADANHPTSPSRRLVLGTVLSAVGLLLVTAVFGVIGLLSPSGAVDWRQPGQVILEQGTGAHFVLGQDKKELHPVINEASALLLAGADKTVTASAKAISAAPLGPTVGITGAPQSLPAASALLRPALVSCTSWSADEAADTAPTATVVLTRKGPASSELRGLTALQPGSGLLVKSTSGAVYLVTGGYRYRLPQTTKPGEAVASAMGYDYDSALNVAASWIDTVPARRDLTEIPVNGAGRPGPRVTGSPAKVGEVLTDNPGSTPDYYLVRSSGLELISRTEAMLILADPSDAAAYPPGAKPAPVPVSVADVAAVPQYKQGADALGYPSVYAQGPSPVSAQGVAGGSGTIVACSASSGGTGPVSVATGTALPLPAGATAATTGASGVAAAQVYVPPGAGALLAAQVAPGAPVTATYLVTDDGLKFPLGTDAQKALGYASASPAPFPPALLALLPTGPELDVANAETTVTTRSSP